MDGQRSEPLSIETLLQKQREEKEAASKVALCPKQGVELLTKSQPRFLSKEERAKLAIAKRVQEIHEEKERQEVTRIDREALEREAGNLTRKERPSGSDGRR
jgi:ATP-dependent RNA helicase DDX23/PRP28